MAVLYRSLLEIVALCLLLAISCSAEGTSLLHRLTKRQTTTLVISCPNQYNQRFQDPSNCSSFFECNNNQVVRYPCAQGQVYSPQAGACGNYEIPPGCVPFQGQGTIGVDPPSPTLETYRCPRNEGHFQDSSDCSGFYVCTNNQAQRFKCPDGQLFDPTDEICSENHDPANCVHLPEDPSSGEYQCTSPHGTFQDTSDCSRFYVCENHQAVWQQCPSPQLYDPSVERCSDSANPLGCHLLQNAIVGDLQFQCPTAFGDYQDTSDCSRYFRCNNYQVQSLVCPNNQLFYPNSQACSGALVPATPTGCNVPAWWNQGQGQPTAECPGANGDFQDRSDCTRYFRCTNYQSQIMNCPSNQLFDPSTGRCSSTGTVPNGCNLPTWWNQGGQGQQTFQCPSAYGDFQDASDCSRFYRCTNFQVQSWSCGNNQLFDPSVQRCSSTSTLPNGCEAPAWWNQGGQGQQTFQCPNAYGDFQDSSDCSRFYRCTNFQVQSLSCGNNQLFDPSVRRCSSTSTLPNGCTAPAWWNQGGQGQGQQTFNCPQPNGEFQYPDDCSMYWRCDGNIATASRCQGNLLFNPARGYCDWPSALGQNPQGCRVVFNRDGQNPIIPGSVEAFCQNSPLASLVAHPRICNAFYMCGDGALHTPCIFCGDGLYFNAESSECLSDMTVDMAVVCPGRVMVAHENKTMAQIDGSCWPYTDRPNPWSPNLNAALSARVVP
ncbi:peritrophic matrix protein 9 [Plakobranchus ocellatus]|uniref:Peritrophic matrix protein 9 n=1 Tax=Plakobranchus ocellatus TaxID=259542 RepID=A0AAV3Z9T7_9GAST|nr:peritrophic matrix protein 9 [Plakobranchus ocellatus]